MIITGDHAITTRAVAEQIGLFKKGDIILTGSQIEKMSDTELKNKIENIRIIARALPIQKLRIVDALQKKGHIVAMTGDGVNDAPALKKADIGIAMGITGTSVAKEVSKATLVDDNFATIVKAIGIGRHIYNTLIRSAKFFLSCNGGEITAVFMAIMLRFPLPLLPLQILLMNMLTDNFPALGLGFESVEEGIMKLPPRNPKEKPITKKTFISIVIFGLIMGAGTLYMFIQYKDINLSKAQTIAFTTLVMFQMFAVMSSRSLLPSIKKLNPFSNMWLLGAVILSLSIQAAVIYISPLQIIFGTTPLFTIDWLKIIAISSLGFIGMELSKLIIIPKKSPNNA
jgi:Ca2+-transporting ATPase